MLLLLIVSQTYTRQGPGGNTILANYTEITGEQQFYDGEHLPAQTIYYSILDMRYSFTTVTTLLVLKFPSLSTCFILM